MTAGLRSARLAGLLYLAIIGLGLFGEAVVRGPIVVSGDAAATAGHLVAAQGLWRLGIATDLLMHVLDVPLIVFFYLLLRPVDRPLALLATALNLVQTGVLVANKLGLVAALLLVTASPSTAGASPQDLQALAYVAINVHNHGFGVGLIFFGLACVVRGYLMARSGFVPPALGWLLGVAGVCYLVNSVALIVAPGVADLLFPAILLPSLVGELAVSLWLVFKARDAE